MAVKQLAYALVAGSFVAAAALHDPQPLRAQEVTITGPLFYDSRRTGPVESGLAFTLHGMSGAMIASGQEMTPAPVSSLPIAARNVVPRVDGNHGYIGSGLRGFYQGEHARVGATVGLLIVDRGLSSVDGASSRRWIRPSSALGVHTDVFAGGQLDLRPVFPYLDLVGFFDIVQTRFEVEEQDGAVSTAVFNAYLFGVGPRLGAIVPISQSIFLDLAAASSVVGTNRILFTAGFGFTSGRFPAAY